MSQITQAEAQPAGAHPGRLLVIAAVAQNGVIGAYGKLPWRLPEDLKHFKALTLGHPVIMGRRTWESLKGPLPGRENVVVTRKRGYEASGASVAASLEGALALCAGAPVVFVIGGADLYAAALPLADGLVLTEIHRDYEGDVHFPSWNRAEWREAQRNPHQAADGTRFDFVLYERKR
jgi:dihydrofolate reductase